MRGLYLVTPDWDDTERLLAATAAALRGGAACVQYRHKLADGSLRLQQAVALNRLCRQHGRPLIINDDLDLALAVGAAGVHLGREDGELAAARQRAPSMILGASCYNDFSRAEAAVAAGAHYIAFGAMFPSPTKPSATPASVALLKQARQAFPDVTVACIGGITADNAPALAAAGADLLAVISDVYAAVDPEAQARRFAALFS